MKITSKLPVNILHIGIAIATMLLSACSLRSNTYVPYSGPVAPPQVTYRIDDHRFFEYVPYKNTECGPSWLYYTDTVKGIHTKIIAVSTLLRMDKFVIDAANDQYLVGPIVGKNEDCRADTSDSPACSDRIPYSTDAGKTWKLGPAYGRGRSVLVGSKIFLGNENLNTNVLDLSRGIFKQSDWKYIYEEKISIPKPRKTPIDDNFHCDIKGGK